MRKTTQIRGWGLQFSFPNPNPNPAILPMQVVDNLQGRRRYVGGDGNLSHQILVGTEAKPFASKGFGFKPAQDLMPL